VIRIEIISKWREEALKEVMPALTLDKGVV
jgi:hypothetical protein